MNRRKFLLGTAAVLAACGLPQGGSAFTHGAASTPVFLPTTTIAANSVIKGLSNGYLDGFNVAFPAGPWAILFNAKMPTAANLDYPLLNVGTLSATILTDNGTFTLGVAGQGASPNSSYGFAATGKDDAGNLLSPRSFAGFAATTQNGVTGPQQKAGVSDGATRTVVVQSAGPGAEIEVWTVDNNCCAIKCAGSQITAFGAIAAKPARLGCIGTLTPGSFHAGAYQCWFMTAQKLSQYQIEAVAGGVDPQAVINFSNNGIDLLFAFNGNPVDGKVYTDLIQGQTATAHGTFTPTSSLLPTTVDQNQIRFDLDAGRVFQNAGADTNFPLSGTAYGADGQIKIALVNKGDTVIQIPYAIVGTMRNGLWTGVLLGPGATRFADYRAQAQKFISGVQVGNTYLAGSNFFATGHVVAHAGQSLKVQLRSTSSKNVTGTLANNVRNQSSSYDATVRDHYPVGCSILSAPGYGEGWIAQIFGNASGLQIMQINCALSGSSVDQWLADTVGFNSSSPLGVLTNFLNDIRRYQPKDIDFQQGENNLGNTKAVYKPKFAALMQIILDASASWGARLNITPFGNNFSSNPNYDVNSQAIRSAQIEWVNEQIAAGNTRVTLFYTTNDILRADTDGSGIHRNATAGGYGASGEREAQSLLFNAGYAANSGLGPQISSLERISNTVKRFHFQQNGGTGLQTTGGGAPTGFAITKSNAEPTSGPTYNLPLAVSSTAIVGGIYVDVTHADDGGATTYGWYQWGNPGLGTTDIAEGINNALNDNRVPAINTLRGYPVVPLSAPIQAA